MTSSTSSPGPVGPSARLAYDDLAPISDMGTDCEAAGRALHLSVGREAVAAAAVARAAVRPAPSIHFADFPREVPKRDIEVGEAAQRLANALSLYLD
ncbi:hypothetical protein [Nocardioides salarius]|uniref:hypothetical protein n=1 Tax=Nocardioides salarius TaxID=374513 RepID=UPI0030F92CC2